MREKVEFIDIVCRPYDNFINYCIPSVPTSDNKNNFKLLPSLRHYRTESCVTQLVVVLHN